MKVLYLYREVMPYNVPVLRELVAFNCSILFVHDDSNKLTPYHPPTIEQVTFRRKSEFSAEQLILAVLAFQPDVVYIADRTIAMYNRIGIILKKKGLPVISGNDTPWYGGKQWFNIFTSFFRHRRFFSHMQVAGLRQFEYAKKLGFKNDNIIWPMYSADLTNFLNLPIHVKRYEKATDILFVGRFNKVKGIIYLIEAWNGLKNKGNAKLHLVGNGDDSLLKNINDSIVVHSFSNQSDLAKLAMECKAFILPSVFEPWGVVVHEFAAAGMPLIVTDVCGSSPHFVKNNYNGYLIKPASVHEISFAIQKVLNSNSNLLYQMGARSRELSLSITPKLVASALLSVARK